MFDGSNGASEHVTWAWCASSNWAIGYVLESSRQRNQMNPSRGPRSRLPSRPNPRLQRTPSAPLSRKPLGDFLKRKGVRRMVLRKYMLIFGGVFFLMSALQIVRFFNQSADIWWTPKALGLPLAQTSDRVEVYVRDVALQEHVKAHHVQLLTDSGTTPVTESDIRLRFNNWDRIRAQRIPSLLSAGIGLGAAGVFFLLGVLGWGPVKPVHPIA